MLAEPGEEIEKAGNSAEQFFYVVEGIVELVQDGDKVIELLWSSVMSFAPLWLKVSEITAGGSFGEIAHLNDELKGASARAPKNGLNFMRKSY